MFSQSLATVAFASLVVAQTVTFEGRIPKDFKLTDFDKSNKFFGADNVLGAGLKFSDVLLFPEVAPSIFDVAGTKPFELTLRYASQSLKLGGYLEQLTGNANLWGDPATSRFSTTRRASAVLSSTRP